MSEETRKRRYRIEEAARRCGIGEASISYYVERQWVVPAHPETREFDEEDIARARLIHELMEEMGVNAEAVPIILHLVDQLHAFQLEIRRSGRAA